MAKSNLNYVLKLFKNDVHKHFENNRIHGKKFRSRRAFVKNAAMASITLGLTSPILESCSSAGSRHNIPKIAIVGGGIAGLHAGHILSNSGLKFTLFEASNRVGGRIYTIKNEFGEDTTTELGGEFIDSNHADMISLVNEFGLSLYDTEENIKKEGLVKDAFYFSGRHFSENELISEFSKYSESIALDIQKVVLDENEDIFNELDAISISDYLTNKGITGWLFDLLNHAYTSEYGIETAEQSSLNLIYMLNPDTKEGFKIFGDSDERYKIIGGNSLLTDKMFEKLKDSIKLSYQLGSIKEDQGKYKLAFTNNETLEFDYIIIAIPFSVLRKIELDVQIPKEKLNAINELGYGTSSKMIFGVNQRVWRDAGYSGYLFSDQIQNGWDSALGQNNNKGYGSYTVFLGGNAGKMASNSSINNYITYFKQIFSVEESHMNNKSAVINWLNAPNFSGGYSVYKVGQWSTIAGYEKQPVDNIFFAGEHCSEDFQGYMNGGAETGRLAAEALIDKINSVNNQR